MLPDGRRPAGPERGGCGRPAIAASPAHADPPIRSGVSLPTMCSTRCSRVTRAPHSSSAAAPSIKPMGPTTLISEGVHAVPPTSADPTMAPTVPPIATTPNTRRLCSGRCRSAISDQNNEIRNTFSTLSQT